MDKESSPSPPLAVSPRLPPLLAPRPAAPEGLRSPESPLVTIPLLILGSIGFGFLLVYFGDILIPFVISLFFVYILRPVVDLINKPFRDCCPRFFGSDSHASESLLYSSIGRPRHTRSPRCTRCPQWVGVIISLLIAFCVIAIFILLISDSITSISSSDIEVYQHQAIKIATKFAGWAKRVFGIDIVKIVQSFFSKLDLNSLLQNIMWKIYTVIADTFFIMLFVLYLLFDARGSPNLIRDEIDSQIQHYLGVKTIISAFVGCTVFLVLGPILHIRFANLIGIVTYLLNYIPNVGPIIATLLPAPFILLDPSVPVVNMIFAFTLPSVIHFFVGNFAEPAIFGRSFELHPVVVLLSLALWYALWGVSGAILAVPITAVLRIILVHLSHPYAKVAVRILNGNIWSQTEV